MIWLLACSDAENTQEAQKVERIPSQINRKEEQNQVFRGNQPFGTQGGAGSGGEMQDPSGFPSFHDWPAPKGPSVEKVGSWSKRVQLTERPYGGYRPQIAIAGSQKHVVYYNRQKQGDIIQHRIGAQDGSWSEPSSLGHSSDRNWGPDIIARDDESVVVVYDHALSDFSSQGYITIWNQKSWSEPFALTPSGEKEVGSGHIAAAANGDLAYLFIGKKLGPEYKFQARYRWFQADKQEDDGWSSIRFLSDGKEDAWHTNVEARPDGSVLGGFDVGTGGAATTLYLVDGKNGRFSAPENVTIRFKPGERPHFAFYEQDGRITDYVTWFHKERGQPKHIYVMSGRPKQWGNLAEPSQGYGGFHFDPEIAVNKDGTLCLVWGWDSGADAELVYSVNKGAGWSKPLKVADVDWGKPGLSSVDVDSEGNFHVVWNQGVRGYNEVYYARLERP